MARETWECGSKDRGRRPIPRPGRGPLRAAVKCSPPSPRAFGDYGPFHQVITKRRPGGGEACGPFE